MKLHRRILTAAFVAAALSVAAPAFAAFDYSVHYVDGINDAVYPATAQITTNSALTFFTVSPGGSSTGSNTPTNVGLMNLLPQSTDTSGVFTLNSTHYTATVSLQTVANLNGTGPIGFPANFIISGDITGTLGPDSDNTTISVSSGLPTSVVAGGITYNITLDSIRSPGVVSGGGNTGGITLHIVAVPEPASAAVVGLGSVGLLLRRRRK